MRCAVAAGVWQDGRVEGSDGVAFGPSFVACCAPVGASGFGHGLPGQRSELG